MQYGITNWESLPQLFDLPMAARIVGMTPAHLSKMAKAGKFPAHKVLNSWRVDRDELKKYIMTGYFSRELQEETA